MNIGDVDNDELVLGALSSSLAGAFGRDAVAWRCLSGRRAVSLCLDGELVKLSVFGVCFINRVPFVRGMRPRVGRGPVSSWSLCAPR